MFPRMQVKRRPIKSLVCLIYRLSWLGGVGEGGQGDRKEWQRHALTMIFVPIWFGIGSQVFFFLFTKSKREGKLRRKNWGVSNNPGTMKQSSRLAFISFKSVWSIHAQYSASITSAASIDTANRVSGARSSSLLMTIRQKRLQRLVHSYIRLHRHQSCSKRSTCVKTARRHAPVTHRHTLGAVTQHTERQTTVPVAAGCIRSSGMRLDWWQNDKTGILSFFPHHPKSTADRKSGKNRLGAIRRAPTRRGSI